MFSPGQALGNYRILSQIGVGGMGVVYLAAHPLIGKKVALKVIHRELASNREVVGRFFREAKAVNQIGHEHIVQIHDFGQTDDGHHFFIMEFLEGRTLAEAMAEVGALEVQRALHIGAQIANGLSAAHDHGIIHRDLKPDNVMLVPKLGDPDFVKVLDFGLAKLIADGDAQKLTAQGVVLGTPQYMSPEACESKKNIDHRSDVYSLGVLLFQMLCGRVPFSGESMGEILVKQVAHPPPAPRGFNPSIPPSVEQVVLRCLAKSPDHRFSGMRELRQALLDADSYLASSPPVVPSSGRAPPDARTMYGGAMSPRDLGEADSNPSRERAGVGSEKPTVLGKVDSAGGVKTKYMPEGMSAGAPPPLEVAAGPGAKTAYMPDVPLPDVPPPAPPQNATMMIRTPQGYRSRPPRRVWPVVAAVLVVLSAAGGGFGIFYLTKLRPGDESERLKPSAALVTPDAGEADGGAAVDEGELSGLPPADAGAEADAQIAVATVRVTTSPSGAAILDRDGNQLGVTPTTIEFEANGEEHELTFRHPQAREHRKVVLASGDISLAIELEPIEARRRHTRAKEPARPARKAAGKKEEGEKETGEKEAGEKKRSAGDGVLMPDF